ncbi:Asp23/Gls24 family envelope stress response protein [Actinomadura harenae]|uniref:Asp23/Gls24 family envelope stress response protein n=1 Tax=Actinomadura harenae TaxID=2483351 RepID=UPI0011C46448|nr:Asp23/Gls24 family envelope stress response protein [Actinomadura harenae]
MGRTGAAAPPSVGLAERVAAAVTALPDVAGLAGPVPAEHVAGLAAGPPPSHAAHRAEAAVIGVVVEDDVVEIGVVARFGRPLADLADAVRAAARPLTGARRVDVLIADIVDDDADGVEGGAAG